MSMGKEGGDSNLKADMHVVCGHMQTRLFPEAFR